MKKKKTIILLLVIIVGISFWGYIVYGREKANNYITMLKSIDEVSHRVGFSDDVRVEKIIKQTPTTLVIRAKWGDNEKMYLTINKWMTRGFDTMEVDVIDKNKSGIMRE
ncbi:hypothetical protein [Clostridium sp.]|uniref:hypothetical protein n=1 Tax=Clostridium sp. TaxID=1506 RepID=UPI002FC64AA7